MNDEMKLLIINNLKNTIVTIEDLANTLQHNKRAVFKIVTNTPRVDIFSIIDELLGTETLVGIYCQGGSSRAMFHIEDIIEIVVDKLYKNRNCINNINYIVALPQYQERIRNVPEEVLAYVRQFKVEKKVSNNE